ncbi:hypothetical protein [Planomonospora algeriensis]
METILHAPVRTLAMVEVRRTGQIGGQAGDAVHDLFSGPHSVQASDVAAKPEGLPGTGEQGVIGGSGADRAALTAAVPTITFGGGGGAPLGIRAARRCSRSMEPGVSGICGTGAALRTTSAT